jgi:hypothetical protein
MSALFLRHEGFLGAVGAFLKVHPMHVPTASSVAAGHARAAAAGVAGGDRVARQDSRVLHESASTKVRGREFSHSLRSGFVVGCCCFCVLRHCMQYTWLSVQCDDATHSSSAARNARCNSANNPLPHCALQVHARVVEHLPSSALLPLYASAHPLSVLLAFRCARALWSASPWARPLLVVRCTAPPSAT